MTQTATSKSETQKLIVGMGSTGLSCARFLRSRGVSFRVMDSRFSPPALAEFRREFPDVEIQLGGFSRESILDASEILLSPGIGLSTPEIAEAVRHGVSVVGDIDIFSREAAVPVVAVTGSNGKSTVVTLLGEMARQAGLHTGVGGNLDGRASMPALDLLRDDTHQLYVLELSSFQLETTQALNAEVATILNISEDHLDRYSDMNEYRAAKQRVFVGCHQMVLNRDEKFTWPEPLPDVPRWTYGLNEPDEYGFGVLELDGEPCLFHADTLIMPVKELKLKGAHNISNALAAFALGHAVHLPWDAMRQVLREFGGLPHRCQRIRVLRGVSFFNDSKGTNVHATVMAINSVAQTVDGQVVLIAGGLGKGADFSPLLEAMENQVKSTILLGRDAPLMSELLSKVVPVTLVDDMEQAVSEAFEQAQAGDAVLLSPACASFDMFKDFSHRGRVFTAAVEALH